MAKQLIRYEFESGDSILVETQLDEAEPGYARAGLGDIVSKAPQKLQEAFGPVIRTADIIISQLESLPHRPEEISLEFGIKFSIKGDIILAGGEAEANCKVSLKWHRPS
jgi:hypothetical protein